MLEKHVSGQARQYTRLASRRHLGHRCLDEFSIWDAGWAGHLAGPALNAQVPVVYDIRRWLYPLFIHRLHQGYSASGGLRLQASEEIGWAGLQAKSTVDALVQIRLAGCVGA